MARYNFEALAVLLIDDSPMMRRVVNQMLHAFGVESVHIAADGKSGLKMLNAFHIDLVITDWLMEPMDGFDFVRLVRTDPYVATPMVPILMMTAHSELWRVAAARDAGINEFILKPITPANLLSRLIYMIEKPRPFVRTHTYFGPDRRRKAEYPYFGPDRRSGEAAESDPSGAQAPAEDAGKATAVVAGGEPAAETTMVLQ